MSTTVVYLLYADDGATLVCAGTDAETYARHCRELAPHYAGALVGRRRTGRIEQWEIRSFFRTTPTPEFIAQRRHGFPYGLVWEPAEAPLAGAADDA